MCGLLYQPNAAAHAGFAVLSPFQAKYSAARMPLRYSIRPSAEPPSKAASEPGWNLAVGYRDLLSARRAAPDASECAAAAAPDVEMTLAPPLVSDSLAGAALARGVARLDARAQTIRGAYPDLLGVFEEIAARKIAFQTALPRLGLPTPALSAGALVRDQAPAAHVFFTAGPKAVRLEAAEVLKPLICEPRRSALARTSVIPVASPARAPLAMDSMAPPAELEVRIDKPLLPGIDGRLAEGEPARLDWLSLHAPARLRAIEETVVLRAELFLPPVGDLVASVRPPQPAIVPVTQPNGAKFIAMPEPRRFRAASHVRLPWTPERAGGNMLVSYAALPYWPRGNYETRFRLVTTPVRIYPELRTPALLVIAPGA